MKLSTFRKHVKKLKEEGWIAKIDSFGRIRLNPPEDIKNIDLEVPSRTLSYEEKNMFESTECCPITAICLKKFNHYWLWVTNTFNAAEEINLEFNATNAIINAADNSTIELNKYASFSKEELNLRKWLLKAFNLKE